MTKFHKIQQYLSIIPFISTLFIFVISMIELRRYKAAAVAWVKVLSIFVGTGIVVTVWNIVVMTGENPILNILVSWLLCSLANLLFVDLQCKCMKQFEEKGVAAPLIKKEVIALVAIIVLFFSFVGGSVTWIISNAFAEHHEIRIADTNGATDFTLQTITAEKIVNTSFGATQLFWSQFHDGGQSDISDRFQQEVDYDEVTTKAQEFSGVDVVHATKSNSESLTLTITSTITAGNFAIVIVVDGRYYCNVEINQMQEIRLDNIANKTVLVKIAGESAEYEVNVVRKLVPKI